MILLEEYIVKVPKKYRSCRWNSMRVQIIDIDGDNAITVNKKGKVLSFHRKWLIPVRDI